MRIVIGCLTFGTIPRLEGFFRSLQQYKPTEKHEVILVAVDDGTPQPDAVRLRGDFCRRNGIDFIAHGQNLGISAGWNTILNYAVEKNAEVATIFNDDIRFIMPGWLDWLAYFFEKNDPIASVGWPLLNDPETFNPDDPRWDNPPGRVGAAVGCSYGIRPEVALSIVNPDNSRGFWTDLISFHEETHLGLRLSQDGFLSYMLPYCPVRHAGGSTFSANPHLIWRKPSSYLPLEVFLPLMRQSRFYYPQYEQMYSQGMVDRMGYARLCEAKYWGLIDQALAGNVEQTIKGELVNILDEPSKPVHALHVDKWPARTIRYLDRNGVEREYDNG